MENKKIIERLKTEQERVLDALSRIDPYTETEKYYRCFDCFVSICFRISDFERPEVFYAPSQGDIIAEPATSGEPLLTEGDLKAMEECAEQLEAEKQRAEFLYTKEAVREILTDASKKGVKIKSIIEKHIPEGAKVGFSSVPADEYEAVVAEVNECLNAMPS